MGGVEEVSVNLDVTRKSMSITKGLLGQKMTKMHFFFQNVTQRQNANVTRKKIGLS